MFGLQPSFSVVIVANVRRKSCSLQFSTPDEISSFFFTLLNPDTGVLPVVVNTSSDERKNTMEAWANHVVGLSEKKY